MTSGLLTYGLAIGGALSLGIGIGHLFFYRFFNWGGDFKKIGLLNSRILYTIHLAAILFLIGLGIITLFFREILSQATPLAVVMCMFLSLFWLWRLLWQIVFFRPSKIEHNNGLLILHYILIALFAVLFVVYAAPVVAGLHNLSVLI